MYLFTGKNMTSTIRIEDEKIKERFDQIQRDQSARLRCNLTQTATLEYILETFDAYWKVTKA
jgi:exo-beta-1,3-glucanase (GH17 family)